MKRLKIGKSKKDHLSIITKYNVTEAISKRKYLGRKLKIARQFQSCFAHNESNV